MAHPELFHRYEARGAVVPGVAGIHCEHQEPFREGGRDKCLRSSFRTHSAGRRVALRSLVSCVESVQPFACGLATADQFRPAIRQACGVTEPLAYLWQEQLATSSAGRGWLSEARPGGGPFSIEVLDLVTAPLKKSPDQHKDPTELPMTQEVDYK